MKNDSGKQNEKETFLVKRRQFVECISTFGFAAALFPGVQGAIAQESEDITVEMISSAEKIAGVAFTDAERRSMVKSLNALRKQYEAFRAYDLPNSVPPALVFNPVPPGIKFTAKEKPFRLPKARVSLPSGTEDLAFYPVTDLARLLETRKITSTELTRMYLARLKKYGPALRCVVTLTEDLALRQAGKADEEISAGKYRGHLHGIPWGAKDLLAVKGFPTTWGSEVYRGRVFDHDATVVSRLGEAGAVLMAKLSMGRYAGGENWFGGQTLNPWNLKEGSSGSSAGPGAAAAAGLVGFSIGTETRGSIAGPCERCGVSGLRPTYGRVSRYGAMTLSWSLDKIGPICRTAEDCAVVFNVIRGTDKYDNSLVDAPFSYDLSLDVKKLRVGYVKAEFQGELESIEDRAKLNKKYNNDVLDVLRSLGVQFVPIELPEIPRGIVEFILSVEAAAAFDYLNSGQKELLAGRGVANYRVNRLVPAVEYIEANRVRTLIMRNMEKVMSGIDAYVTPSFVGPTNWLTNLTGHPELIVPNGFLSGNKPISISFVGRLFEEATILALGAAYQKATNFHLKHPEL